GILGGAGRADDDFFVLPTSPTIDAGDADADSISLLFGGLVTGYTTRTDGLLDGSAPDGPLVDIGFHYPAPLDPLVDLAVDDVRLFYGRGDQVQILGRKWDHATGAWDAETRSFPSSSTVKWVVNKVSPISAQEELLSIFTDDGSTTKLFLRIWNGHA